MRRPVPLDEGQMRRPPETEERLIARAVSAILADSRDYPPGSGFPQDRGEVRIATLILYLRSSGRHQEENDFLMAQLKDGKTPEEAARNLAPNGSHRWDRHTRQARRLEKSSDMSECQSDAMPK